MMPSPDEQHRAQLVFFGRLADRLEVGRRTYGDASLTQPPADLKRNIEEEILDIAGWAFVLWLRLQLLDVEKPRGADST